MSRVIIIMGSKSDLEWSKIINSYFIRKRAYLVSWEKYFLFFN